jgi:signal transduction histidine kinase
LIVTLVLAYLAAHDARTRRELGSVAAWTTSEAGDADSRLRDVLSHVAAVVDAPRVLLVWRAADQPGPRSALWAHGQLAWTTDALAATELSVAEALRDSDFVCRDATQSDARVVCRTLSRSWRWRGRPFGDEFQSAFAIRSVIAVCFQSASLRGRLFVLDKPAATSDDLVLATVVARQVANVLEHDYGVRRLQNVVLAHERDRIARDVHDGALQWLAGAALRLETIRRHLEDNPTAALDSLRDLQATIMLQQRELRSFVRELQTGGCANNLSLADLLSELVFRIEREWQLAVKLDLKLQPEPLDTPISPELAREIHQIVREALVNTARHTLASLAQVSVGLHGDKVQITVADNGQGFPFRGRFEDAELAECNLGPVMLKQRIAALGGRLVIDTSDEGARLEITLPRHGANRTVGGAGPHPYPPSALARSGPLA